MAGNKVDGIEFDGQKFKTDKQTNKKIHLTYPRVEMECDKVIHILIYVKKLKKTKNKTTTLFCVIGQFFQESHYSSDTGLHWVASFLSAEAQTSGYWGGVPHMLGCELWLSVSASKGYQDN